MSNTQGDLRPYQNESVAEVKQSLAEGNDVVLQMPTGAGKTRTGVKLLENDGVVWFVCHRREIVRQTSLALDAAGVPHAVAAPGHKRDPLARVQVCSVGSIARRMKRYPTPRRVLWDECHHIAAGTWSRLKAELASAEHIGLTATPTRGDKQGLEHWFDSLIVGPSISELIRDGYLSPYRLFAPSQPSLGDVPLKRGDYEQSAADKVMRNPRIVGDAVATYLRRAQGKRAVAFATSVAASIELVDRFNAAGVPARHVDGKTPVTERDEAVADLAAGRILVLSNYGVFTEGFDVPAIDAVILMRPTKSLSLYLQMVGRGLRTSPGKTDAILLDHAGLVHEHGLPDAPIEWTLVDGARRERGKRRKPALLTCPKCGRAHKPATVCPECGHKYKADAVREALEGELEEYTARQTRAAEDEAAEAEAERIIAAAMDTFVSQAAFGRIIGKTPAAIARLVLDGLPTNAAGEVQVSAGLAWIETAPKQKRAARKAVTKQKRKWRLWPW